MDNRKVFLLVAIALAAGAFSLGPAEARYIGAQAPFCCACSNRGPCPEVPGGMGGVSLSEGNLRERYSAGITLKSASGPTLDFSLSYNSMAADGSQSRTNTGMGYGWTHSYNILLFSQLGHMFRMDGEGRVTKYKLGPGGTFTVTPGYFETLTRNANGTSSCNGNGTFTLRYKDGSTYDFGSIVGTPLLIQGPVYRLTKITDRTGNVTCLSYSAGKLVTIADTYGRQITLGYVGTNLATVTDPLGRVTRLFYEANGGLLTQITGPTPERNSVQYSYNSLAQMVGKVDKDGRVFSYLYNSAQKPVAIQDSDGNFLFRLANPGNWATNDTALASDLMRVYQPSTTSETDGNGNLWSYDYDSNGYITRVMAPAPESAATRYSYDPATLQVASLTDANTHTTSYQYDVMGNLTSKAEPSPFNYVTRFEYESVFNQMTKMTDANGRVTTRQIDSANGNLLSETDPLLQTRTWTYDSRGNALIETDKRLHSTIYVYDPFGNRVETTDREGHVWKMTYDAVGNLTTRTVPLGHITHYDYDEQNRLVTETAPLDDPSLQADTDYFYDGQGNRIEVIDRNVNATSYHYDVRQRLDRVVDAQQPPGIVTYTFDGNNNRVAATDKNRHTTTFQYDGQNRPTNVTDAEGNSSSITYDPVGNRLSDKDGNLHTTVYAYDELNRPRTRTDAEGYVLRLGYDMVGTVICAECTGPTKGSNLVTMQTDGNGRVTYNTYDALDRLVKQIRKENGTAFVVDSSDAVTSYVYDANNNVVKLTEPNGNSTSYEYDSLDRRTRMTNAASDTTLMTYDPDGNLATITEPNLNVVVHTYDALDRLSQASDSIGRAMSYTYDPMGNRLAECDGNVNCTLYDYDAVYRLTDVTDAAGKTTSYTYDAVGNLVVSTDRELHATMHAYDKINRRIQTTDPLGNVTDYRYDGVGNLEQARITDIVNGKVGPTDYLYDRINRVIQQTYADGKTRSFAYDAVNLIKRTDQKGQVTNYAYSGLYFLVRRSYASALMSPADNMTYDLSGRMLTAERDGWVVTFAYDGANRVTRTTQDNRQVAFAYDIPGRTRALTYPGGRPIVEQTDARARLVAMADPTSGSPQIGRYSYDLGNRTLTRAYRNGVTASYGYNSNNWVLSAAHTVAGGDCSLSTPPPNGCIAGFGYAYDNEGNRGFEKKSGDSAESHKRSESYRYDVSYRLIDYKVGVLVGSTVPMPTTQTHYDLDGLGNWAKKLKDTLAETRTHDLVNAIASIDIAPAGTHQVPGYDDNGNLTDDNVLDPRDGYRYDYDEENRLTTVDRKSDGKRVGEYKYDALSRRIGKIADAAIGPASPLETRYFYDDARIIEEQNAAGATQATYVYGNAIDEMLTMDRGSQSYYYHQNALGSVVAVTDSSGNVVERYVYDAYGVPSTTDGAGNAIPVNAWLTPHTAIGNPWTFTGRQLDEESGLYFYRARHYDPIKGRFLQRDPLQFVDGMNLYAYVRSNPVNLTDPYGQEVEAKVGATNYRYRSDWNKVEKELGSTGWAFTDSHLAGTRNISVTGKTRGEGSCCCTFELKNLEYSPVIIVPNVGTTVHGFEITEERQRRLLQNENNHATHNIAIANRFAKALAAKRECCYFSRWLTIPKPHLIGLWLSNSAVMFRNVPKTQTDEQCAERATKLRATLIGRLRQLQHDVAFDTYYARVKAQRTKGELFKPGSRPIVELPKSYFDTADKETMQEIEKMKIADWSCADVDGQ